jgi:uncharacterized protein YndB with AHSA1/START domain
MSEFKLEVELRGDTEIVMKRNFRAPQALVFRCFTEPELLRKWLAPPNSVSTYCVIDTEIGGVWRHKLEMGEDITFDSFGQTLDFDAPNRYVRSDVINVPGLREAISTETATFSESGGVTTVELAIRHLCKEYRDACSESGVAEGSICGYETLDSILADLQSRA